MLLRRLRRIILQDSALMRLRYPNHYVFRDPLFETDIFKAYALRVVQANNTTETPMDLQLQQAMPRMVERVDVARDSVLGGIGELQASFAQDICTLAKGLEDFGSRLEDERDRDRQVLGKALSNIAAGISLMSTAVMETRMVFPGLEGDSTMATKTPPVAAPISPSSLLTAEAEKSPSSIGPSTPQPPVAVPTAQSSPAARVLAALKRTGQQGRLMFEEEPTAKERAAGMGQTGGMEKEKAAGSGGDEFVLERDHKTVDALWREYDEGIFGRQSVRSMIERDLKKSESQRKRWERRRIVINEIKRLKKERTTSAQAVVEAMDRFMKKERLSMAKLQDRIAKASGLGQDLPLWE